VSAPDLSTPEGKLAYRSELRAVARLPRLVGLAAIVAGAMMVVLQRAGAFGLNPAGSNLPAFAVLAGGWVLLGLSILQRNRYHRRRMAGE
jgi:hypothetical protein